ncbi:hypothetical protein [Cryobacterium arcticum]|uniref:Alpha/beta hydrolase n=1 Tax=Cryobacterium arcticum TaxID=670052 RepID=A0A1B1BM57_9MICO|nr:hypothetical protein [Cryobacterium arcticum]ANP73576.1 alpha/beta hydrolase [Cryobacterium arcticum]
MVRYAAQHGKGRVAKVITAGAVPPLMAMTDSNPEGTPSRRSTASAPVYSRTARSSTKTSPRPIFLAHGDDDQIVPIAAAALKSAELVEHGTLKVYPGAPHGVYRAYQGEFD